jgi:hypothetical protein
MGAERPAIVCYEPDPTDGYPRIDAVFIGHVRVPHDGYVSVDILPILDDVDLLRLEQSICEARPIWRNAA